MQSFLISTSVVALAEIGDKTQLLALLLASRFKKPLPIIAGILVATLVNHFAAAAVGQWLMGAVGPDFMRWGLGISFLMMAIWMLVPDKLDEDSPLRERFGVFGATVIAFFLAEMGDKTQFATVALAARFHDLAPVVAGTTLGMMLANVPAVFLGEVAARKLPMKLVHGCAALIFVLLSALTLWQG